MFAHTSVTTNTSVDWQSGPQPGPQCGPQPVSQLGPQSCKLGPQSVSGPLREQTLPQKTGSNQQDRWPQQQTGTRHQLIVSKMGRLLVLLVAMAALVASTEGN